MGEKEEGVGFMKKIYILHGWAYTTERWQPLVGILKNNGIEAVMLKIPGLTAPLDEVWDLDDYVEWLGRELVHEKEQVVLVGHSNGGRISLAFAAKYPDRVEKLILIDSGGIYHNEFFIRVKRLVFGNLARLGRRITNSQSLRGFLYKLTRESDYERANPNLRKTMRNLISTDISYLLSSVDIPTTIIWGEHDGITPLADGRLMHKGLHNSTLHIIKGAKHSPMFTHAEEVGETILEGLG